MSSNKSPLDESLFQLPEGKDVEVVLLRDENGQIVARTKDELELEERAAKKKPEGGA